MKNERIKSKLPILILLLSCLVFCLCACSGTPKMVSIAVQGEHCTITNAIRMVEQGSTVLFDLLIDEGYYYVGNNHGATYDETTGKLKVEDVKVNTAIVVQTALKMYSVTLNPTQGMVFEGEQQPTILVGHGQTASFDVDFLHGYDFVSANVQGCTFQNGLLKVANVTSDLLVSVQTQYTDFEVTLNLCEGVELAGLQQISVAKRGDAVFNLSISQDYRYVSNDQGAIYDAENGTLTLKNVTKNTQINLTLQRKTYQVVLVGSNFTAQQYSFQVNSGDDATFELDIQSGYTYFSNDQGAIYQNGKLTLKQVRQNTTINVSTKLISTNPTLNVSIVQQEGFTIVGESTKVVQYGQDVSFQIEIDSRFGYLGNDANAIYDMTTGIITLQNVTSSQDVTLNLRQGFFTVVVAEGEGFTVDQTSQTVEENQSVTFQLQFAPSYVYVGNDKNAIFDSNSNTLTISNVTKDLLLTLDVRRQVVVSVMQGQGFSVVGESQKTVFYGERVSFQLQFDQDYHYATNNGGAVFDSYNNLLIVSSVKESMQLEVQAVLGQSQQVPYTHGTTQRVLTAQSLYYSAFPSDGYVFAGWEYAVDEEQWKIYSYANNLQLDVAQVGDQLMLRPIFAKASQEFLDKGDVQIATYHANGGVVINSQDNSVSTAFTKDVYWYSATLGEWCFKTFQRQGYVPLEYNTQPDGTGTAISLGSRILVDDNNVDLYVIWARETETSKFETEDYVEEGNLLGVALTKYTGDDQTLVIPTQINGLPVMCLKEGFVVDNETLQTVVVTQNVEVVENGAFSKCSSLATIYMCDSVLQIANASFVQCDNLANLRMIATWQPYYTDNLLGSLVRRVERLFYLKNHSDKPSMMFYGSSGLYHNIDGATLDQGLDGLYNIVNCAQNGNISGRFAMQMFAPYLKEGDVLYFAPEWHASLLGNRVNSVTWYITEAFYDAWRNVDIRYYAGVFDGFRAMQLGGDGYTFTPRAVFRQQGKYLTYLDFVKTDKGEDQLDYYFTRAQIHNSIGAIHSAINYPIRDLDLYVWRPYFLQHFVSKGVMVFWGPPAIYEYGFENTEEEVNGFYNQLANNLSGVALVLGNWQNYLYPYEYLYDNTVHLTTEGAIINSQKIAETLKLFLH